MSKQKIIVATLFRDNESFIPYYLRTCQEMEAVCTDTSFSYLFYTNNNTDKTLSLLQDQRVLKNAQIIHESYDDEHLELDRTIRLSIYRDKMLEVIRESDIEYFLFIDTEIFFNGLMIQKLLSELNNSTKSVITPYALNNMGIYFDSFACLDENNKYLYETRRRLLAYLMTHFGKQKNVFPVKSAFGGMYLAKKEVLDISDLSYFSGEIGCEHLTFNKKLYEHGYKIFIDSEVTPIWAREHNYKIFYKMTRKAKTDFSSEMAYLRSLLREGCSLLINSIRKFF